jgi:hypothetical protein
MEYHRSTPQHGLTVEHGNQGRVTNPSLAGDVEIPHNLLAAHMFHILTGCQAMQHLQINPTKNQTIHTLLQRQFPAIKSSNNKPTYYVTPKTIGYIHGIVTDCITCLSTDACNQRAL